MTITVEEAMEKLKDILSHECKDDVNGRVFDRHLASALSLELVKLRGYIYRDELPIMEITKFLLGRNINVNEFFASEFDCEETICKK